MRVVELRRYPVKSLQGEQLDVAAVTTAGLEGDRRFALFDVETGFGLTGRRVPELLFASARFVDDGGVEVTLPDGSVTRDDDALSAWLGRRVMLRSADAEVTRRYENVVDFEDEATSEWEPFDGACRCRKSIAGVSLTRQRVGRGWDRSGGDGPFVSDAFRRVERAPAVVAGAGMGVRRRGGIR